MIKPLPDSLNPVYDNSISEMNDDEMFLNDDEVSELKRERKLKKLKYLSNYTDVLEGSESENIHVIFKRRVHDHHDVDHHGLPTTDFGTYNP